MNKGFPENVYRAPYEFISATTYGASSLLMVLLPIPKNAAIVTLLIFFALVSRRMYQALRIVRYRKNIRRLPNITMMWPPRSSATKRHKKSCLLAAFSLYGA